MTAKKFPTDFSDIGAALASTDSFMVADASAGYATRSSAVSRIWDFVIASASSTGFNRGTGGTADTTADLKIVNGSHWMAWHNWLTTGAYNPAVQSGDHAILYTDGSQNTGGLFIGPWSNIAAGVRINAGGSVTISNGSLTTPSILGTSVIGNTIYAVAPNISSNAVMLLQDEAGLNQAALYWNRSDDTVRLGLYDGTGTTIASYIAVNATSLLYGANTVWHAGNLTVAQGTWSPTATAVTNVAAITTPANGMYMRVGGVVFASCEVTLTPTAGAPTATEFRLTLPVTSNLAQTYDLDGVVSGPNETNGQVYAEPTTDVARCLFNTNTTGSHSVRVTFGMKVL